jgi:S-sulfo-L-cysteine synthase (O-acetyl-L-serine-dependent)
LQERARVVEGQNDLWAQIGNTPLLRLRRVVQTLPDSVEVYAKAEHLNPGGSVKDRPARAMLLAGERAGLLTPDKIILDATSGNTGIAYAMLGAARGYRVALCLPANANVERKQMLRLYGAELIETDPQTGADGAQLRAQEIANAEPQKYFYPDQYNNDANWRAHYETTGAEIWTQTEGRITHFITGMGTSGTLMGVGRRLKEHNPRVRVVAVQPDSPLHGLEGMKHYATAIVPGIYDPSLADAQIEVATEAAYATARRLAREEGLFVGISSGANVVAALQLAHTLPAGSVIVTVLCDDGARYLSEHFWEQQRDG